MMTPFITSRWSAAAARVPPSTSMIHGTAHRPWIAMNDPMPRLASGAIHQKRGCTNTLRTPASCAASVSLFPDFGTSGTRHQMRPATKSVTTASTTKIERHPVTRSASSTGTVASSAPMPPATMIQPEYEACRSGGNHVASAFNGAIRHAETPAPMTARATASADRDSAAANSAAPAAASASSTGSTRRGP